MARMFFPSDHSYKLLPFARVWLLAKSLTIFLTSVVESHRRCHGKFGDRAWDKEGQHWMLHNFIADFLFKRRWCLIEQNDLVTSCILSRSNHKRTDSNILTCKLRAWQLFLRLSRILSYTNTKAANSKAFTFKLRDNTTHSKGRAGKLCRVDFYSSKERLHSSDQHLFKFMGTKEKRLHKKRVQFPQDWFGTPIWPPWRHVKTLYYMKRASPEPLFLYRDWK